MVPFLLCLIWFAQSLHVIVNHLVTTSHHNRKFLSTASKHSETHHDFVMKQEGKQVEFKTFWKVLKTDHAFVMKQGLRIHLKGLRPRRKTVN